MITLPPKHGSDIASPGITTLISLRSPPPALLRVACARPTRSTLLSDGSTGRRGDGCVARLVQSSCRSRSRIRSSRVRFRLVFAQVAFGVMSFLSSLPALARGVGAWKIRSAGWRPWWMKVVVESSQSSSPNNLAVWCCAGPLRSAAPHSFSCHHGDGGEGRWCAAQRRSARWGSSAATLFGSESSAAFRRLRAALLSTLMAERQPLRALAYAADLRIYCRCQLIFNLPAGVPKGRPYGSSSAALFGGFIPSGSVPGDGVAGRDWMHRRELGGQGPDCFFNLCFGVLFLEGLLCNLYCHRS